MLQIPTLQVHDHFRVFSVFLTNADNNGSLIPIRACHILEWKLFSQCKVKFKKQHTLVCAFAPLVNVIFALIIPLKRFMLPGHKT